MSSAVRVRPCSPPLAPANGRAYPAAPQQEEDFYDEHQPLHSELSKLKGDIDQLKVEQKRSTQQLKPLPTIEWTEDLSVGVDLIDKQHMILVRAINLLGKGVQVGCTKELMAAIFDTLADYTVTHFAYEEELFQLFDYPATEAHKHEHAALLNRVTALKKKWESGETEIGQEVLNFLVNWLKKHILGSDKKYGPFLVEQIATASKKDEA